MNYNEALDRFNLISGSKHKKIDLQLLPSGQRARFISICIEKDYKIDELVNTSSTENFIQTNDSEVLDYSPDALTGVGIDIQEVNELFPNMILDLKSNEEIISIFSQEEIAYAETKINPLQTLTGIFSAKEAIFKTGRINNLQKKIKKIEIKYNENGKPQYKNFFLSISHSKNFAIAIAMPFNISQNENKIQANNDEIADITSTNSNKDSPATFKLQNIIITIILSSVTFVLLSALQYMLKYFVFLG